MLTVKRGLDPHMIIKLKDGCKLWVVWVLVETSFKVKWVDRNLHLVTEDQERPGGRWMTAPQ
jgi:hypothetical protein